jgi:hypothetical protein
MFKFIGMFLALSVCIFCAINLFLIPQFPEIAHRINPLTPHHSLGLSAIIMIGMLFVKK